MKKQSNLSRLLEIAGSHRVSDLCVLDPLRNQRTDCTRAFYYIWKMMQVKCWKSLRISARRRTLTYNGWMAVMFAVIAVLVYIAGLMCSHLGHFVLPPTCVSSP